MTNEEKNKKICQILGIHWHEYGTKNKQPYAYGCPMCGSTENNPDFYTDAGAVRLLREIKKQKWYVEFVIFLWDLRDVDMDTYDYIITAGLLADKVIEWKEEKV